MEKILAWHFVGKDGLTSIGKLPVVIGQVQEFVGRPILCKQGLHWSIDILDALRYAKDTVVCRVEAWGGIEQMGDKGVSNFRLPLWKLDIEHILHEFACDEAERAMKLTNWTDERSWQAIDAKRKWLKGEISDDELKAFQATDADAAAYAARAAFALAAAARATDAAAARAAVSAAAYAARAAAADAYAAAARAADYAADYDALAAAAYAARAAYRKEQNARLEKRVLEAYENAN